MAEDPKPKTDTSPKLKSFKALTPINTGSAIVGVGETVKLDDLAARDLLACGAVEAL